MQLVGSASGSSLYRGLVSSLQGGRQYTRRQDTVHGLQQFSRSGAVTVNSDIVVAVDAGSKDNKLADYFGVVRRQLYGLSVV